MGKIGITGQKALGAEHRTRELILRAILRIVKMSAPSIAQSFLEKKNPTTTSRSLSIRLNLVYLQLEVQGLVAREIVT